MKKVSGSFRISSEVKEYMDSKAKQESRSFNNMLEVVIRRQMDQESKTNKPKS